ncbi:MAG: RimK family protein [Zoogloea sp.]|nr:RimK family protein [Zoogloea sp.]
MTPTSSSSTHENGASPPAAEILIVVSNPRDWPLAVPGVSVVAARPYLTDPAYGCSKAGGRPARVFNLCKSYRYQSLGYYVSLLAEARGHRPLPRVNTIGDLRSQNLVRLLAEGLDALIQKSLAPIRSDEFVLSIYFGRNTARRYDSLSRKLFNLFQAPLLRAHFGRKSAQWKLKSIQPIAATDIPAEHQPFVVEAATDYFEHAIRRLRNRADQRYSLAILHDPETPEPASNSRALKRFEKAAQGLGMEVEFINRTDLGRLSEFDALFIRDTTFVNHYTYHFSRRAAAEGMVVIDDPDSILRCNNKVYLAELLASHGIPAPRTLLVHRDNMDQVIPELALPCVLKQPDSAFSLGVVRADSEEELRATMEHLLESSELIVAQEYIPTEFDWRVGILDRKPLYVCKYYMAAGHWQIIKRARPGKHEEGATVAVALEDAPGEVIATALRAANLIGDGLYGVDLKEVGGMCYVIEVNDNPNIDAGNEDGVQRDALYTDIMGVFLKRLEGRKRRAS